MRLLVTSLLIAMACLAGSAPGQPDAAGAAGSRDQVLALIRAGEDSAALAACRAYAAAHPGDLPMRYNLACLEARSGHAASALATLQQVVAAGYDNLEQLTTDPDLAPLADDPRFIALVTEIRTRLVLAAAERGVRLAPDRPAELRLSGNRPNPLSSLPSLVLVWEADALLLRLDGGAKWLGTADARPGLVVTLGLIDPQEPYRTGNSFVFAFGRDAKGHGWGAVWVPTLGRWQRIAELAPRSDGTDQPAVMRIPWSLVQPLHPLTDPVLGINAALDGQGGAGQPGLVFAALDDPRAFDPTAATRRVVRLDFATTVYAEPAFLGRLEDSIVTADILDFTLVAVPPTAGRGTLRLDFLDNQGRSVLPQGPQTVAFELRDGRQELARQATFAGLGTGSFQLRAEIAWPGQGGAVWGATLLNLAPGWDDSLGVRIAKLNPADRRTALHYLDAVRAAVAAHRPRRHPGPIATTLGDLDAMLARSRATGSIIPTGTPGLLVYGGPDGTDRLCSVYRPAPGAGRGRETPILVLDGAPGGEDQLVARLVRFYEHGDLDGAGDRHPLYLVPHLPVADRPAEARAALEFVRSRFRQATVPVAGIDAGAGSALGLATDGQGGVAGLMILAGANLEPWPGAADADLAGHLEGLPPDLPLDWTDFSLETARAGQAAAILRALADDGTGRTTLRTAGGGLSLSQAADRIVLWAEQLPVPGGE